MTLLTRPGIVQRQVSSFDRLFVGPRLRRLSPALAQQYLNRTVPYTALIRCLDAGKPLTGTNLKAALNSIKDFDTGGLIGVPITISGNSIPVGRVYRADMKAQKMVAASDWIKL